MTTNAFLDYLEHYKATDVAHLDHVSQNILNTHCGVCHRESNEETRAAVKYLQSIRHSCEISYELIRDVPALSDGRYARSRFW